MSENVAGAAAAEMTVVSHGYDVQVSALPTVIVVARPSGASGEPR